MASNCQFYKFSDRNFPVGHFYFLIPKCSGNPMQKSLQMVFTLCWEFMEKFLYNFEEKLNKLSLLCHVEKEEGKVVLRENSQLVDQLEPAAWWWISRVIRASVLRLTPIRLINPHSALELEMVRALWRVPVEECAAEGHLVGWSVCLSAELILPADEVSLSGPSPAPRPVIPTLGLSLTNITSGSIKLRLKCG